MMNGSGCGRMCDFRHSTSIFLDEIRKTTKISTTRAGTGPRFELGTSGKANKSLENVTNGSNESKMHA
jgi:hypothetical protein